MPGRAGPRTAGPSPASRDRARPPARIPTRTGPTGRASGTTGMAGGGSFKAPTHRAASDKATFVLTRSNLL